VPLSPSLRFEETMGQLAELNRRSHERRSANMTRLAAMVAALDAPLYAPSSPPDPVAASHSTPMPTPPSSEADDDDLRARLPARSDPNAGGPYGRSILDRVARSYGIE
jgi:hypothetical protein